MCNTFIKHSVYRADKILADSFKNFLECHKRWKYLVHFIGSS